MVHAVDVSLYIGPFSIINILISIVGVCGTNVGKVIGFHEFLNGEMENFKREQVYESYVQAGCAQSSIMEKKTDYT
jgi:hypothetical protein